MEELYRSSGWLKIVSKLKLSPYKCCVVNVKLMERDVVHVSEFQGESLYVGPGWVQDDVVHQDLAASLDFDGDVGRVDAQEV